ncbi:PREDICTED: integrator complex subunit 9 isoform X2 [Nicotiana attenuata]|uniref:integrator complex subunit 9 isoform X2 n=1 Tax=Nicotiana attenuata TaxID=49451 RepID=UPI000905284F|nr:PREDICTED: integrator complex subunit 9 isoform X2 [Nicotiana attenuata]
MTIVLVTWLVSLEQYEILVGEKLLALFRTMKFTCLSEGRGYYFPPCHIVNISGFRVLFDCPLDLSALTVFSPLPIVTSSLLDEKTSNVSGQSSSNSESVRREVGESLDSKSLIQAEPWYKTVKSLQLWSIYSIDVVLISSPMGMLGLPFLTRLKDFRSKVYVTEAASRLGKLMMEDLVSMHMELRQFYGPEESGCPQWMTWEKLELLPMALKDIVLGSEGTELGGWMPIYSAADIKGCMEKVQSLKYAEEACYNGALTIKAFSSGLEIGACNWNILSPKGSITYLSGSVFASTTASSFDYKALEGSDVLLYSDFTACNDVDSEKNEFPPDTASSYPSDTGSCWETITESWLDSDEYSEEMEKVSFICQCALDSINDGGSVLIPIGRPGIMLKLLEHVSLSLESSNLKVPIYFVSSAAEELLAFSNIIPEWLSSQRQERLYSGQPLFTHIQLSKEKKLLVSPAIHSSKFLTSWQEPCIAFCPHWSLRLGPVVHLLQRWCADPNSLLIMEEGADINLAFLPFKPMSMKVLQCSFISGIKLKRAIPLLKILQPKHVVPEGLRSHISCWNPTISVSYFSENETVVIPKLNYADMYIAMDLAPELLNYTKVIHENNIVRLKGELLVEQGKHQLVLGKKQVLSSQDRPLLFLGRVDLNSLLMALKKMGMKATAHHAQIANGSETVYTICISEPNEALIEVTASQTMISVADENTASLVSEAVRSTLVCI